MMQTKADTSWPAIHELEVREAYPVAIDALESRLVVDPADKEAVIRLGFNLWYVVVEHTRMKLQLPVERYASRFMELFDLYSAKFSDDADFCWAFGLGMSLCWHYFPGATEDQGNRLLERARAMDPLWAEMFNPESDLSRFKGRGIFAAYYHVR